MRKLIAILFLLLTVVTTEAGIQLLKLPMLINHFAVHISEGRSKGLRDFLHQHYSTNQHNDSDSQQDQQLPFKTVSIESFYSMYVPVNAPAITHYSFDFPQRKLPSLYSFHLQDHCSAIFHPPQSNLTT